ncbi:MAG: primosomal protein N' [Erysipelotrichales bacterium]|nr:primosomal protein N' [Erysipelotrichales bacterium]
MIILNVLIEHAAYAINRPFSYVYEGEMSPKVGERVQVSFHNSQVVGYIIGIEETNKSKEEYEEELGYQILVADKLLDSEPILTEELRIVANEVSKYYLSPLISVYQAMLPPSLKPTSSAIKKAQIAYEKYLRVINEDESNLTPKQIELLRLIKGSSEVKKNEIKSISILNKLIANKNVEEYKVEKRRYSFNDIKEFKELTLTYEQQKVKDEFLNTNDNVYLLEGVTGSGKTEVYISIVKEIVASGKTALILVPEINLTPVMMQRFYHLFKEKVAILHSELTSGEKYDEYRKILHREIQVVIGTRSAVFAPLDNLGIIILDEEHVESYKQDNAPCYHAKDVAIMRAKHFENCKVLLGSATPTLESEARALKGVYHHLRLLKRINERELPETEIINLQDYRNIDYLSSIFSKKLRAAIKETLDKKEQVVLLLNRRGYSTSVLCRECGHVIKCPECDIPLVYHSFDKMLKCHNCGHVETQIHQCPECGSKYLSRIGFGSEKVEDEIRKLFPTASVLRLDSDVGKVKNNIASTLKAFSNHEADILIGTQMIAKGHDFPDVTLVGLVLADLGLTLPSARSSERTFQLITQAIGRAGRGAKKGRAIIQTYMPTHYSITYGAKQDYMGFYKEEMRIRKLQQNPPYTFASTLTLTSKNEDLVNQMAFTTLDLVLREGEGNIIGVGPSSPYVKKDSLGYRRICMFKYKDQDKFKEIMQNIINILSKKAGISIKIDIDALDI